MLSFLFAVILLLTTPVNLNENIDDLPKKHPLGAYVESEGVLIADSVETQLVSTGINPRMARAAVVNAYAESGLDPHAVGDNGRSVGIFQLSSAGLGHSMTIQQRMNVRRSTARIAAAVLKDDVLMQMQKNCASLSDMVKAFTIRIERPNNAKIKAQQRAALSEEIHHDIEVVCEPKS